MKTITPDGVTEGGVVLRQKYRIRSFNEWWSYIHTLEGSREFLRGQIAAGLFNSAFCSIDYLLTSDLILLSAALFFFYLSLYGLIADRLIYSDLISQAASQGRYFVEGENDDASDHPFRAASNPV